MDLCNPTGDTIHTMFDSVPYVFKPRSVMTLADEAGRHVAAQGMRYGIIEVHFGDDPDKIRYSGLRARVLHYQGILNGHDLTNARQSELKFPAIVDSDAVKQARIALPIYQKALGRIEERLGDEAAAFYEADLKAMLLNEPISLPHIKDASLDQLRGEASRLGVEWKPGWNYLEIREAIEATKAVKDLPPVPAGQDPAPSGINVAPGPDPNVHPEDLSEGVFDRM